MKFTIPPESSGLHGRIKGNCMAYIGNLGGDQGHVVTIGKVVKRRNNPQNERFHATASALAKETGYTQKEMKDIVKEEMGWYELVDGPFGQVKRYKSSSDMSKAEMAEAIEILNRWCVDLGVPIAPSKIPEWVNDGS
jgi:hypothetical protein